jgi:hypothetical protein
MPTTLIHDKIFETLFDLKLKLHIGYYSPAPNRLDIALSNGYGLAIIGENLSLDEKGLPSGGKISTVSMFHPINLGAAGHIIDFSPHNSCFKAFHAAYVKGGMRAVKDLWFSEPPPLEPVPLVRKNPKKPRAKKLSLEAIPYFDMQEKSGDWRPPKIIEEQERIGYLGGVPP